MVSLGQAMDKFISDIKKSYEEKEKYKKEKNIRKGVLFDKIKIGDVFYTSWGYDQTNVEMYQVIEKKGTSKLLVREIETDVRDVYFDSGRAFPVINKFIGEPIIASVNPYGIVGKGIHETAYFYDIVNNKNGVHTSWGR